MKMMSLDKFNEWVDFYKELISWELKLSDIDENTMSEILNNQKSEANRLFSKFIEKLSAMDKERFWTNFITQSY